MNTASEGKASALHEWEDLIREFGALDVPSIAEAEIIPQFEQLLCEFESRQAEWREEQRSRADNFNILGTMQLTRKELCHSDILAWLLDSKGTHAQGNLGFRLFLRQLNLPEAFAEKNYKVLREMSGDESRLDIVVKAVGEFIIAIENKIDSEEGEDQTNREWRDLEKRRIELNIPVKIIGYFLTPDAAKPLCNDFKSLSWRVIADIFQTFADEAKAELVRLFALHYAQTIRHEIVREII